MDLRTITQQEDSVDMLFDTPGIPTSSEAVLEMDTRFDYIPSPKIDAMVSDLLPSDLKLFDFQGKISVLNDKVLDKNGGSASENKCEKAKSSIKTSKNMSKIVSFKSSPIKSDALKQQTKFQNQEGIPCLKSTYFCGSCSKKMNTLSSLLKHKSIHSSEKHFQYSICQQNVFHVGDFSQRNHAGTMVKFFLCAICQQIFLESDRDQHMRIHTAEKSIQCDVCKKKFSDESAFIRHKRIHTGEKPFRCDICEREFSRKDALNRHMLIHTEEKLYWCHICKRKLSRKDNFTRHMQAHTKDKCFPCKLCEETFLRKRDLTLHIRRTHTGN